MTYTTPAKAVRGGLLAAALLVAGAAPAQATHQDAFPGDWLYLTVTHGDAQSSDTRGTLLLCDPPQGHAHAAEACDQLEAVGGRIDRMRPKGGVCPLIYAPVTAHARGVWHGMPVTYSRSFGNACEMADRTGSVFALGG
ncbi:SSI family serine proteinase inhibitor [Streptomyces sp. enrichment culture]|uniref:SSI family serine proteinase inhibitor n=1 Tax=Streptomyces sp. enrichment culture TaxID=1795815 RepID=UPI003F558D5C